MIISYIYIYKYKLYCIYHLPDAQLGPLQLNSSCRSVHAISEIKRYDIYDVRRVRHELFLTKGVPQQIPAGLEILRKFFLAWRL